MPIFYDVDLDDGDFEIDAEDFYSACDTNEIDNLIDYLEFDGYVERIGFGQSPTMADTPLFLAVRETKFTPLSTTLNLLSSRLTPYLTSNSSETFTNIITHHFLA